MPRHQTARKIGDQGPEDAKLSVFRKYAQISAKVQEYGSASLSAIEAVLTIVAASFLYTNTIGVYTNYASYFFIIGQSISLVPNSMDMYELIGHMRRTPVWGFMVISHFIVVASYITGTLLIICGSVLTLNWLSLFIAAPWVFLAASVFFTMGAVFGASDSLINADPFTIFFGSLFGKCMVGGTFSFLFGSILGVIKVWSEPAGNFWISNIQAGTFQAGGIFFLLGAIFSFVMIVYKYKQREERIINEHSSLIISPDEH